MTWFVVSCCNGVCVSFFFQAEDGIRDLVRSRGLGDVYKRQGQYIRNVEAEDFGVYQDGDQDTAWLVGLRTNIDDFSIDYNYRDVQNNAVVGGFTDSDFAAGFTGSSGHKLQLKYEFLKNFSGGVTYFNTEADAVSRSKPDDAQVDVIQIDLNARF